MGSYNELILENPKRRVQFKYGLRWQYEYHIGEKVRWENIKKPIAASGGVVISGISSNPLDGSAEYFAITIVNDKILSATEISQNESDRIERHLAAEIAQYP